MSHWQDLFDRIHNQVHVEDSSDAYRISVFLHDIEQPNDIEASFDNGYLKLRRTVQFETKRDLQHGAVWQSYYEHFERLIPINEPINWRAREISASKGCWSIRLPKRKVLAD